MHDGLDVELRAITPIDLNLVGKFLQLNLNSRVSASAWASALAFPWAVDAPNHGFMLVAGDTVVGVHLAFYSERCVGGARVSICNLGAWSVDPKYRQHGVRLLRALLKQRGYEFTDLSPSGNVVPLNRRLKFRSLDTSTALVPTFPHCVLQVRRLRAFHRPVDIDRFLGTEDRQIYDDHRRAAGVKHLLLVRGDETCHVMYRRDRRKNLPWFATVVYVSNAALFRIGSPVVSRHLLFKRGIPFMLCELRITGHRPRPSVMVTHPRPKMFRSEILSDEQVDYLYSELTCVAW